MQTQIILSVRISLKTHEGVSKASEADLHFLNAEEQMELTTTMSDRQKLAAAVITAQIKLTEHPWDEDMGKPQSDIQKLIPSFCYRGLSCRTA